MSKYLKYIENEFTKSNWEKYRKKRTVIAIGLDSFTAETFTSDFDSIRDNLLKNLKDKTFSFKAFRKNIIYEEKKNRIISIPSVLDKFLDFLTAKYIEEYYEIDNSKKNIIMISARIQKEIKDGIKYFLKTDISAFFDSIPHLKLMSIIKAKPDSILEYVINDFLKTPTISKLEKVKSRIDNGNNWFLHERRKYINETKLGVHQGLVLSQTLAELYIKELDKLFKSEQEVNGFSYFRFVDDILLIFKRDTELYEYESIIPKRFKVYDINISKEKTMSGPVSLGFDFLGFKHKPRYAARTDKSVKRFKNKWVSALINPQAFIFTKFNTKIKDRKKIYNKIVSIYNVAVIGYSPAWIKDEYGTIIPFGIAIFNSFCTDINQIKTVNKWMGTLFCSYSNIYSDGNRPRLEDLTKWYFKYKKDRNKTADEAKRIFIKRYKSKFSKNELKRLPLAVRDIALQNDYY